MIFSLPSRPRVRRDSEELENCCKGKQNPSALGGWPSNTPRVSSSRLSGKATETILWFEWEWLPQDQRTLNVCSPVGETFREGLEAWPCWRALVTGVGRLWVFRRSCHSKSLPHSCVSSYELSAAAPVPCLPAALLSTVMVWTLTFRNSINSLFCASLIMVPYHDSRKVTKTQLRLAKQTWCA